MNCQEMNHLLDAHAPEALTARQHEAIGAHLASCATCSEDWANWHEMAALPVPPTPVTLRARIAAALPAQVATPARRVFRPYVVGGVLLAGAALAAAIGLQLAGRAGGSTQPVAAQTATSVPVLAAVEDAPSTSAAAGTSDALVASENAAASGGEVAASPAAQTLPPDPHRIFVVKMREPAANVGEIALMERCHDGIVRELRTLGGIDVVTDPALHTITTFEEQIRLSGTLRKAGRGRGAGKVLTISTAMGCNSALFHSDSGELVQGAGGGGVDPEGVRVEGYAKGMASSVRIKTLMNAEGEIAAARAVVLDASLPDGQRASALWAPMSIDPRGFVNGRGSFYDAQVLAAATTIGVESPDADARISVWAVLRRVDDPSLVKPLMQVLASDADSRVRYQAALTLNTFLDQPGVREALLRAAAEDPQQAAEGPCCTLTVREAALRASVANKDFREWVHSTLLDEKLPTRTRLISLQNGSPDGRFSGISVADFGRDAAQVVFDIGRREQDPHLRGMAWNTLWRAAPDESFLPVLISDLASHPSALVRAPAARILAGQVGNPQVRAALEQALGDASTDVRRYAAEALSAKGR